MDQAGDWQRLCALLDDDDAVWEAVSAALEEGEDPWDAVIGGLDDAGALAYLQADDTGMELTDALAQLPRVHALQPDLDEATDTDDLDEAVGVADGVLVGAGLRLIRLIEPGDDSSRPMVTVLAKDVAEIDRVAAALGGRVVVG
jgi:hypothetical protein